MTTPSTQTASPQREDHHDVVCIGFGLSALSIAVAHRERNPEHSVLFLEAQQRESWNPFNKLPGQDLNTSFIHDLVTTNNPRSPYSFVKYLHATRRLVNYTNVGKVNPSGELFTDYLHWVAKKFDNCVRWGTRCQSLQPKLDAKGVVQGWVVSSEDVATGSHCIISASRVIVAVGSQAHIPHALQQQDAVVVHASECSQKLQEVMRSRSEGAQIAIVGQGQAAAEVLEYLHGIRGPHTATLFTESASLLPHVASSFEVEATIPSKTTHASTLPPELRGSQTNDTPSTPHATSKLLERLYELQYTQRVKTPDPSDWRFQIAFSTKITKLTPQDNDARTATITYLDKSTNETHTHPRTFDLIVAATGVSHHEQDRLLRPLSPLSENRRISVNANYRVNLPKKSVAHGIGIWLVGSLGGNQFVSL
jgi:L-ornithine N5-monooxygenase